MNEAQKLATRLTAYGDAVSANGNSFYLLQVEEDQESGDYELYEQYKTDLTLVSQTLVASNVRKGTSAAYLLETDEDRIIFYIDESNSLKASMHDLDPKAPDAYFTVDSLLVFFQTPGGSVECIGQNEGKWSSLGALPAEVPAGSPHYPLVIENKLYFYYIGNGGTLRYLTRELNGVDWDDKLFNDALSTVFVLTGGTLVSVDANGDRHDLVKSAGGGKFIPVASAERAYHIHIHGDVVIRGSQNSVNLGNGKIEKGSRRRIHRRRHY
ncbi:hypothetical protein NUW58_g3547 [Xylaria curta]|uniref:Uncharacterized protein n=1 Tax=Xylaria curta TaxID=42375 RepID=A0ACC1PAI5_9PEZI|nr:hypothetical protein NUW58_g3547 [Xylaria curta]